MNKLIVLEKKGQPVTTSRKVAEVFNRNHDDVLRSIRNLDCSSEFSLRNFAESNYKIRGKMYPEYLMTKDGFAFLAMGFTGKKAAAFKEAYINAFNEMESFIKSLQTAKLEFPAFTDAIMQAHEEPKHYHFSNEINMINKIVLGMNASKFKEINGLDKKISSIRPYISSEQIKAIEELQRVDIGLIVAINDYEQRKKILEDYFRKRLLKLIA